MTKAERRALVAALMTVTFLGALDITIVTIAGPQIAQSLSGFDAIGFLFSAYTLAAAATIPVYGKLADLLGRKRMLTVGVAVFLAGSLLCGVAPSMAVLIAGRAVQGAGAGAVFTLVNTVIGDVFPVEARAKAMGVIGTVWGVASLVGPFAGGLLIDLLSWHWVFLVNLPLGLVALVLLHVSFKERYEPRRASFDVAGAVALTAAVTALLLSFNALAPDGGEARPTLWSGAPAAAVLALAAAAALAVFVIAERRAADPIIPRSVNTRPAVVVNVVSFVASMVMMGSSVYLPVYFQDALHLSATVSGLAFLPQSLAWLAMSFTLAPILIRFGARRPLIALTGLMLAAYGLYCLLTPATPLLVAFAFVAFSGFGLGGVMNSALIVIQESVETANRGAAVGLNSMLRFVGQAIGAGVYGGVFNAALAGFFTDRGVTGVDLGNPYAAVDTAPGVTAALVTEGFGAALQTVFILLAALTAVAFAATWFMPKTAAGLGPDHSRQS
ncbi:MAG: MFS transporter [Propionibacteriaceae bacterium]|jgi:EmrB/QacA subfamily drug resistance transporter|nr:MFS transporter [Propionibacteriaceae bacterium]